ncbi:tetratricopeptide repeat protein [Rhodovibrionaceae bacterium A322]
MPLSRSDFLASAVSQPRDDQQSLLLRPSVWRKLGPVALATLLLAGCASSDPTESASKSEGDQAEQLKSSLKIAAATHESGDLEAAQRLYSRLIKAFPGDVEPRLGKAGSQFDAGLFTDAKASYEEALELEPGNIEARIGLGRTLLALGKKEAALAFFSGVHREQPENYWGLNGSAVALDMLGRHAEAQGIYQMALRTFPGNQMLLSNQALSYSLSNQPQRAVGILTSLGPAADLPPRIRQNLALAYGLTGNEDKAAETSRMDLEEGAVENNLHYFRNVALAPTPAKVTPSGYGQTVPLPQAAPQAAISMSSDVRQDRPAIAVEELSQPKAPARLVSQTASVQPLSLDDLPTQSSHLPLPESALARLSHLTSGMEPSVLLAGFTACQDAAGSQLTDCQELARR